jgi:Protein of unknown function (DUF3015)
MRKLVVAAALVVSSQVSAAPYGTAGCGLGSLVFGNQPGIVQVFAATTNGIGVQTFAITTGTSNCQDSLTGKASVKVFIETNKEALAKDISRGQGETLKNLVAMAGCQDVAATNAALQKNFNTIFPSAQAAPEQVSEQILTTLAQKPLSCSKVV